MKLPRIAYRKSIKPSQIIPPSCLPARRHDITSWQRPFLTRGLAWTVLSGSQNVCSALPRLLCCGLEAQPARLALVWVPLAPPQNSHGIVPNSCAIQPSQRN